MVSKIFFILLIILLSMVGFAAYQNPQTVDFTILRGMTFHVSLTVLVLFAFCLGALIVLIVTIIRDTRRSFRLRKERKNQRKEMEKLSVYSAMLERLLWGNAKEIENQLTRIGKDFKQDERFLRIKAELYKRRSQWAEAYQIVSQLRLAQDPPKISTMMEEATLARKAEMPDKARLIYREILTLNATYLPALEGLRELLEDEANWGEIIPIQERILKSSTHKEEEKKRLLRYQVKHAMEQIGSDQPEEAWKGAELARTLLKKDPQNRGLYVLLGHYYQKIEKPKDAVKIWEKGFNKTKDPYFLTLIEALLTDEGKENEGLKRYGKALRENPGDIATAFFYARYCLENEKADLAQKVIEELPEAARSYPAIQLLKAKILAENGKKDSAYETCSEVVSREKWMDLSLVCRACGHPVDTWQSECPYCGAMNSIAYNLP